MESKSFNSELAVNILVEWYLVLFYELVWKVGSVGMIQKISFRGVISITDLSFCFLWVDAWVTYGFHIVFLQINLLAARNERESFQIAMRPKVSWAASSPSGIVQVQCSDLCSSAGDRWAVKPWSCLSSSLENM